MGLMAITPCVQPHSITYSYSHQSRHLQTAKLQVLKDSMCIIALPLFSTCLPRIAISKPPQLAKYHHRHLNARLHAPRSQSPRSHLLALCVVCFRGGATLATLIKKERAIFVFDSLAIHMPRRSASLMAPSFLLPISYSQTA
jgi:hypothetical protein